MLESLLLYTHGGRQYYITIYTDDIATKIIQL